jgi:hypothetical protein
MRLGHPPSWIDERKSNWKENRQKNRLGDAGLATGRRLLGVKLAVHSKILDDVREASVALIPA